MQPTKSAGARQGALCVECLRMILQNPKYHGVPTTVYVAMSGACLGSGSFWTLRQICLSSELMSRF